MDSMHRVHQYIVVIQEHLVGLGGLAMSFFSYCRRSYRYGAAGLLFLLFCLLVLFLLPPLGGDQYPQVFVASEGKTIRAVADDLRRQDVVISPSLFILSNYFFGGNIMWGSYHFSKPRGLLFYAHDLYLGKRNMPLRSVRVPERSDAYKMADIFEKEFPDFDRDAFLEVALAHHGYLYPDTYLFAHSYGSADHLVDVMTETFRQRTADLFASYTGDLTMDEIVTLASVVELEASRFEDRRKIAQVLLNRLEINMPLQVDVSFLFIDDKHTFQISRADLASDDPSNTYRYAGLPPIPITNPGRASIEAVMNPIETDALYFLADFYGNTYYSKTFQEHLVKKERYIDSVRRQNNGRVPGVSEPDGGQQAIENDSDAGKEENEPGEQEVQEDEQGAQEGGAADDDGEVTALPSGSVLMRE